MSQPSSNGDANNNANKETPLNNAKQDVFIGVDGSQLIMEKLTKLGPKAAIELLQAQLGSIQSANVSNAIPPVFELTDLLGIQRNHLFEGLLVHMIDALLKQIESPQFQNQKHANADQTQTAAEALLEQSFPYIGIDDLRAVPVAVMEKMNNIPPAFLKALKSTPTILDTVPISIKRQVWAVDSEVFRKHVFALLNKYLQEPTVTSPIELLGNTPVDIKKKRDNNAILKSLIHDMGSSVTLYNSILHFCRTLFVNTAKPSFCMFRYELLMGLHDNKMESIYKEDPAHYFAWWLDAWLKAVDTFLSHVKSPIHKHAAALPEDFIDNAEHADIFKRLKDLQSHFDSLEEEGKMWSDISMIIGNPIASTSILRHIFLLIERFSLKQDDQQEDDAAAAASSSAPKSLTYLLHHPPSEEQFQLQANLKGNKKKVKATRASAKKNVIKINLGGSKVAIGESAQEQTEFAIRFLSTLFVAGQSARKMLKQEIPESLPEVPEFLIYGYYPFIQEILQTKIIIREDEDEIDAETILKDASIFGQVLKRDVTIRKITLLAILRVLQVRDATKFSELFQFLIAKNLRLQDEECFAWSLLCEESDFIYSLVSEFVRFYHADFHDYLKVQVQHIKAEDAAAAPVKNDLELLDATVRKCIIEQFLLPVLSQAAVEPQSKVDYLFFETARILREYANLTNRIGSAAMTQVLQKNKSVADLDDHEKQHVAAATAATATVGQAAAAAADAPSADKAAVPIEEESMGTKFVAKIAKQVVSLLTIMHPNINKKREEALKAWKHVQEMLIVKHTGIKRGKPKAPHQAPQGVPPLLPQQQQQQSPVPQQVKDAVQTPPSGSPHQSMLAHSGSFSPSTPPQASPTGQFSPSHSQTPPMSASPPPNVSNSPNYNPYEGSIVHPNDNSYMGVEYSHQQVPMPAYNVSPSHSASPHANSPGGNDPQQQQQHHQHSPSDEMQE